MLLTSKPIKDISGFFIEFSHSRLGGIHIRKKYRTTEQSCGRGIKCSKSVYVFPYNELAIECGSNADSASRKLFEELVMDEERHFGLFDTEFQNMNKFGEQYLALQSIERSKTISTPTGKNPTNL